MKRYAYICRPLSIRRSKVVCSPRGITDEEGGRLVCFEIQSSTSDTPCAADVRTDFDMLFFEDAFKLVPHTRHGFPIPVLGTRGKDAEGHVWELFFGYKHSGGGRIGEKRDVTYRTCDERYLFLPVFQCPGFESLVGDQHDRISETTVTR